MIGRDPSKRWVAFERRIGFAGRMRMIEGDSEQEVIEKTIEAHDVWLRQVSNKRFIYSRKLVRPTVFNVFRKDTQLMTTSNGRYRTPKEVLYSVITIEDTQGKEPESQDIFSGHRDLLF